MNPARNRTVASDSGTGRVSATQFRGSVSLDQQLRETLARFAVDPRWVELELKASALFETTDVYDDMTRRLHELGVSDI